MKSNIVHRHVTGDRIFVDDFTYNNQMNATECHAVFQIRVDLRDNKDSLGRNDRSAPLRWLLCSVLCGSSVPVLKISLKTIVKTIAAVTNILMMLTAAPTRTSLNLFASLTIKISIKALVIDLT